MKIKYSSYEEVELISYYDSKKLYDIVIKFIKQDIEKDKEITLPPIEKITENLVAAVITKNKRCEWTKSFIVEHHNDYDYTLYDYLYTLCIEAEYDLLIECEQKTNRYGGNLREIKRTIVK